MNVDQDGRIHIEDDDAMAGSTPGRVRWMLLGGLLGAIITLSAIWMFGAATFDPTPEKASAPSSEAPMEADTAPVAAPADDVEAAISDAEAVLDDTTGSNEPPAE